MALAAMAAACLKPAPVDASDKKPGVYASPTQQLYAATPNCCASAADFHYQPLIIGKPFDLTIDFSSPAFEFSTGKSFFSAYRLPDLKGPIEIRIRSWFRHDAFFPSALLLDENYAQKRLVTAPEVHVVKAGIFERGHIEANFRIEPADGIRYFVVLTTDATRRFGMEAKSSPDVFVVGPATVVAPSGTYAYSYESIGKMTIDVTQAK